MVRRLSTSDAQDGPLQTAVRPVHVRRRLSRARQLHVSPMMRLPLELFPFIFEHFESVLDVLPWLSTSRALSSLAAEAPVFSQTVFWPPRPCLHPMPPVECLRRMFMGALWCRRMYVLIDLSGEVSAGYASQVLCAVRDHALALAFSLEIFFYVCHDGEGPVPQLARLLNASAPRLQRFSIRSRDGNLSWDDVRGVELFGGVAPQLREVAVDGISLPMFRIRAFDAVHGLHVSSPTPFSSALPHSFIGGCSSLCHLHFLWVGDLASTATALSRQPIRDRVASLRTLDVHFLDDPEGSLELIRLFLHPGLQDIRAWGPNSLLEVPAVFFDGFMRTLPPLDSTGDMCITYSQPYYNWQASYSIAFAPPGVSFPRRTFTFDVSAPLMCPHRVDTVGDLISHGSDIFSGILSVRVVLSLLPVFCSLSAASFPSVVELLFLVDIPAVCPNVGYPRVACPAVSSVVLVPDPSCPSFQTMDDVRVNEALVRQWVELPATAVFRRWQGRERHGPARSLNML